MPCNKSTTWKLQWVTAAEEISNDTAGSAPGWSSRKSNGRIRWRIYLSKHIPRDLLDSLVSCCNPAGVSWHLEHPASLVSKGGEVPVRGRRRQCTPYWSFSRVSLVFHLNLPSKSAYSDLSKPAHPGCHCKSAFSWSRIEFAKEKTAFLIGCVSSVLLIQGCQRSL